MKCPNPKHKKPFNLKTERTMANGRTVTRVRICPKCKTRFETVELFKADYVAERKKAAEDIGQLQSEQGALEDTLDDVRTSINALVAFGRG